MTLYTFLLVFVSLLSGAAPSAAQSSSRVVLASLLLVGGWVVLAHLSAIWKGSRVLRRPDSFAEETDGMRVLMETFRWLAIPLTLLCHFGFSLAAWLRVQPVLEYSTTLQAVGLLAPGLLLLVSTWSAEHCFAAIVGTQPRTLGGYRGSMVRAMRGGPAWMIVPTLVFLTFGDVAELIKVRYLETSTWSANHSDGLMWVLIAMGGSALIAALPWLVRWIAKTRPIGGAELVEIETWLRRCGVSTHPILGMQVARWDTGQRMLNAMVAGFIRPGRLLLLSDRLLDELPRGGRLMVIMHEIAHVRRFHLPIRMAAILPAWWVSSESSALLVESGLLGDAWSTGVGGVLGLITTIVVLGIVSHLSELDADLVACRLAVQACGGNSVGSGAAGSSAGGSVEADDASGSRDAAAESESRAEPREAAEMTVEMAAELLADALIRVTADHPSSRKFSWLHPSLATRVERLRRISRPLPDFASDSHTLAV
ncbi:M48 family metalloprotease [Allorhodopirellula solitaria]|uniref:Peptidase M48 domain-containing protein n=1 Tax=Allorhodopirellula solitaria TaxID=2527987 RepID=A0A5C5YHF9_9BACT|nr:M48 family metalloprotease [Allorhodopirellula solitaria]TWT74095.1 hypothetical protein CA85_09810 [Allorhodopirellula solitaria]